MEYGLGIKGNPSKTADRAGPDKRIGERPTGKDRETANIILPDAADRQGAGVESIRLKPVEECLTGRRTRLAGFITFLAMVERMLFALLPAGGTYGFTQHQCLAHKPGILVHHIQGHAAHFRALDVKADTFRHHFYVILPKARCRTVVAYMDTLR